MKINMILTLTILIISLFLIGCENEKVEKDYVEVRTDNAPNPSSGVVQYSLENVSNETSESDQVDDPQIGLEEIEVK